MIMNYHDPMMSNDVDVELPIDGGEIYKFSSITPDNALYLIANVVEYGKTNI